MFSTGEISSDGRRLSRTRMKLSLGRSSTTIGDRRLKCACAARIWREINRPVRSISYFWSRISPWMSWHMAPKKSRRVHFCWLLWDPFFFFFVCRSIGGQDPGALGCLHATKRPSDFPQFSLSGFILWHDPGNR